MSLELENFKKQLEERRKMNCDLVKHKDFNAEASTRQVLIEPFLALLGYNAHDINSMSSEYPAGYGGNSRPKVDYILKKKWYPYYFY